jgi:GNAT superfamily N-acetyltransferase
VNPRIRPFEPSDLPAIAALHATVVPLHAHSLSELEGDTSKVEPQYRRHFLVAEVDGAIVGAADYHRNAGSYHPHRFYLELYVHPQHTRQGIGGALFEATLEALRPLEAISLRVQVREDEPHAVAFAAKRGFLENKRDFESVLEVARFDAASYAALAAKLEAEGVRLRSWRELDSAQFRRALHAAFSVARLDVPRSEPATPISFEFFEKNVLEDPELLWDASFAALEGAHLIGFTGTYQGAHPGWALQWLTAVLREARGRGVATALKVRQIVAARDAGFTTIRTDNDSRNAAMLAVNTRLGFERQPALLSMLKTLE